MAFKYLSGVTSFQQGDKKVNWRSFLDDATCEIVIWDDDTNTEICRFGANSAGYRFLDSFSPSSYGQTNFTLSMIPSPLIKPLLCINGQEQKQGADYKITGNVLTWLSKFFHLDTNDVLDFYY